MNDHPESGIGHAAHGSHSGPGDRPPHGHSAHGGHSASHAHPVPGGHAVLVGGEPVPRGRVDAVLDAVPARDREARPEGRARAERQRRRWATQIVVADELARRACAARGLAPPAEVSPASVLAVSGTEVADLGSIIAVTLAHSPAARTLLAALEAEQAVPEKAVRGYYDRNPDRFLTAEALRRGVDPYGGAGPGDFLPYDEVHDEVVRELRRTMGRQAFFDWLDRARAGVEYAPGHEHPGDPSHPDHEHRH
ncbi:peptidyl-prolyl cis-trans isomerase [Streptomyces sp. NPDC002787]